MERDNEVNEALAYFNRTELHRLSEFHGHGFIEHLTAVLDAAREAEGWKNRLFEIENREAGLQKENQGLRERVKELETIAYDIDHKGMPISWSERYTDILAEYKHEHADNTRLKAELSEMAQLATANNLRSEEMTRSKP